MVSQKSNKKNNELENKVALFMIAVIVLSGIVLIIWNSFRKRRLLSLQNQSHESIPNQNQDANQQQRTSSRMRRNVINRGAVANNMLVQEQGEPLGDTLAHSSASTTSENVDDSTAIDENGANEEYEDDNLEDSSQNNPRSVYSGIEVKMSKKQMLKMQKKREKQEEKEAREAYLAQKREREAKKEELEKEERERKIAEKMEEEEERKIIEMKKEEMAKQELELWKDYIEITESGSKNEDVSSNDADGIEEFIKFVIENRVVTFENLANSFDLTVQDVINRLKELENEKRIQGIFTDRGKYIYLTKEDLEKVANYINKMGKVTIKELVKECEKMIDLSPKPVSSRLIDEVS